MHPICDAPGCEAEAKGRVTVFADGFGGGLYINLCIAHTFAVVNVWPMVMAGITGKEVNP